MKKKKSVKKQHHLFSNKPIICIQISNETLDFAHTFFYLKKQTHSELAELFRQFDQNVRAFMPSAEYRIKMKALKLAAKLQNQNKNAQPKSNDDKAEKVALQVSHP